MVIKQSRESKKHDTLLLPITLPKVDRFSKFFHQQTQQWRVMNCSLKMSPHLKRVATLPYEVVKRK